MTICAAGALGALGCDAGDAPARGDATRTDAGQDAEDLDASDARPRDARPRDASPDLDRDVTPPTDADATPPAPDTTVTPPLDGGTGWLSPAELLDPAACAPCHPKHYTEWAGSMHAYAAEDPVFIAMNTRGQRETDGALGDLCIQCHAPVAHRMGLTHDGTNLDEIPRHLLGVTCAWCHQVDAVAGTHNNPLRWVPDGVMRGGITDPMPSAAHASAFSHLHARDRLASSGMCGSCHDIVLSSGLHLERTFLEWKGTLFNDEDPRFRNTCGDCHMPGSREPVATVPGAPVRRRSDHRMPGVDLAVTDFPDRDAQRAQVQRALDDTLRADMCVILRRGGAEVELYLENIAAGHNVPSGAAHDRRFWVELVAYAGDAVIYESGVVGDGEPVADLNDPDLWLLRDRAFNAAGEPAHQFWDIVSVESDLLPPPTLLPPTHPDFVNPHVPRRYRILGDGIDRITVRVLARPVGLEVLWDLVDSGDLDPEVIPEFPTFTLAGTVLDWTEEVAELRVSSLSGREALCIPVGSGRR